MLSSAHTNLNSTYYSQKLGRTFMCNHSRQAQKLEIYLKLKSALPFLKTYIQIRGWNLGALPWQKNFQQWSSWIVPSSWFPIGQPRVVSSHAISNGFSGLFKLLGLWCFSLGTSSHPFTEWWFLSREIWQKYWTTPEDAYAFLLMNAAQAQMASHTNTLQAMLK